MTIVLGSLAAGLINEAGAAIALDRTRAIFPGSEKSISLSITNDSTSMPYLAQGWIEDEHGKKSAALLLSFRRCSVLKLKVKA